MLNFILNPDSFKAKSLGGLIAERMDRTDIPYQIYEAAEKGGARIAAKELSEKGERSFVAVGGDGTLNEVLCGLSDPTECTLGLIPAGTGNDFAASAEIPVGIDALDLILQNEPRPVDYIQFDDGNRSINIAGMGIDVDILARCERGKRRGKGKYFASLLKSLFAFKGIRLSVHVGGEEKEYNAMIAAFCNGKQLGGGIPLCPVAVADDGKMDFLIVDYPKRSKLIGALIKLMQGKILSLPYAHHVLCERAVVLPQEDAIAQFDGELKPVSGMGGTLVCGKLKMFRGRHAELV